MSAARKIELIEEALLVYWRATMLEANTRQLRSQIGPSAPSVQVLNMLGRELYAHGKWADFDGTQVRVSYRIGRWFLS